MSWRSLPKCPKLSDPERIMKSPLAEKVDRNFSYRRSPSQCAVGPAEGLRVAQSEGSSCDAMWHNNSKWMSTSDVWKLSSPCNVCHYNDGSSAVQFKREECMPSFESKEEEFEHLQRQNHILKMHIAFLRKKVMNSYEMALKQVT